MAPSNSDERNLLIRRLVRAVRPSPAEAVAQVDRPEQSAASRWRPTSWVHDGYRRPGDRVPDRCRWPSRAGEHQNRHSACVPGACGQHGGL